MAVAFADAAPRLKRSDAVVTGNPIRKEFFEAPTTNDEQTTTNAPHLRRLPRLARPQRHDDRRAALPGAAQGQLEVVHQTGAKELRNVRDAYRESAFADARVVPYLDPIVDEIAAGGPRRHAAPAR